MTDHARAVIIGGGVGGTSIAYLRPDVAIGARGEIDLFGAGVGFEVAPEPIYDPAGERIRA